MALGRKMDAANHWTNCVCGTKNSLAARGGNLLNGEDLHNLLRGIGDDDRPQYLRFSRQLDANLAGQRIHLDYAIHPLRMAVGPLALISIS